MGEYEVQVLDSYGKEKLGGGDMGAVYGAAPPAVNACKPPGEWQKYVIDCQAPKFDGLPVFNTDGSLMMWTSQRDTGSSQVWVADFIMPLDRKGELAPDPAEHRDARPERLQATDSETGLIYLYDPKTHELQVYNPKTHEVRTAKDKAEMDKAMSLFRSKKAGE